MADSGAHHGIDYIEIPVLDMEAAKAFYGAAFGWRFNAYGPDYTGIVDGARGEREAGEGPVGRRPRLHGRVRVLERQPQRRKPDREWQRVRVEAASTAASLLVAPASSQAAPMAGATQWVLRLQHAPVTLELMLAETH